MCEQSARNGFRPRFQEADPSSVAKSVVSILAGNRNTETNLLLHVVFVLLFVEVEQTLKYADPAGLYIVAQISFTLLASTKQKQNHQQQHIHRTNHKSTHKWLRTFVVKSRSSFCAPGTVDADAAAALADNDGGLCALRLLVVALAAAAAVVVVADPVLELVAVRRGSGSVDTAAGALLGN